MLVAMAAAVAGMATLSVIGVASASYDMGPSFGADYGGGDYNCTMWNTPESGAANNYEVAALACEQHCRRRDVLRVDVLPAGQRRCPQA